MRRELKLGLLHRAACTILDSRSLSVQCALDMAKARVWAL